MNKAAYDIIIKGISTFLDSKGFVKSDDGDENGGAVYKNDDKAVKVVYEELRHSFVLYSTSVFEGEAEDNWSALSTWLFEDSSSEADAKSIASDFEDTLKELYNIKPKAANQKFSVEAVPKRTSSLDREGAKAIAGRFLTIFPAYKEAYQEHMATYGQFLPDEFFSKTAAVKMIELLKENDTQRLKKFFNILSEVYLEGDAEVRSIVTTAILYKLAEYPEYQEAAYEYMDPLLQKSTKAVIKIYSRKLKRSKHGK